MGIEYFNHKDILAWMNVGSYCQVRVTDGLFIERQRDVSCPPGFASAGNVCVRPQNGIDPGKNNTTCESGCNGTNPIHASLGTKLQAETDLAFAGGLRFERYYSSAANWGSGRLGKNWRSNFDARIALVEAAVSEGLTTAWAHRPNGDRFYFNKVSASEWVSDPDVTVKIEPVYDADILIGWVLHDGATKEYYDASGVLQEVITPDLALTFGYIKGRLASVTDRAGRAINFIYDTSGRIAEVRDPQGAAYSYAYDSIGNLISVSSPVELGSPTHTRQYLYEDGNFPTGLTGIADENGSRLATWAYDSSRRGILSYHGAGGQWTGQPFVDIRLP